MSEGNTMRKATTATTSTAPHEGAPPPTSGNDSPPPSPPRRSAPVAGRAATSATSPCGTARHRLNDVLGPANWSCRVEPADRWVRCSLTIILPDGKAVTREAVGGYPEMPTDEDKVKGGDSDAFKRACVLFGIGEYLYGDEPAEPAEPRRATPTPTSNGDGRGSRGTCRATASASPTPAPSTAGSRTTATSASPRKSLAARTTRHGS